MSKLRSNKDVQAEVQADVQQGVVYYESLKRELKTKTTYGYRCDERLKTNVKESTRLACTPLTRTFPSGAHLPSEQVFFFVRGRKMEEGMTDALEGENPGGVEEEQTEAAGNVSSWADEMVNTFLVQRTACSSWPPLPILSS
jgi:hypothetical protein